MFSNLAAGSAALSRYSARPGASLRIAFVMSTRQLGSRAASVYIARVPRFCCIRSENARPVQDA